MPPAVIHHQLRTAFELLDAITAVGGLIAARTDPLPYLYRGVGSTAHTLLPAAFRGRRAPFPGGRGGGRRTYRTQLRAEYESIRDFCRIVDARGMRLPEDSQRFRGILADCDRDDYLGEVARGEKQWPPDELLSVAALAQHYGIPTRLLDWSASPFVAAYFAAKSALRERSAGSAAIWAFDTSTFDDAAYLFHWLAERIRIVTAPAADIPNLHAQQGRFLLIRETRFALSATFPRQPYDLTLTELLTFDRSTPALTCFAFPKRLAGEVLALLALLGVDASTVFPGYGGAVEAIREQEFWPARGSTFQERARQFARDRHPRRWRGPPSSPGVGR